MSGIVLSEAAKHIELFCSSATSSLKDSDGNCARFFSGNARLRVWWEYDDLRGWLEYHIELIILQSQHHSLKSSGSWRNRFLKYCQQWFVIILNNNPNTFANAQGQTKCSAFLFRFENNSVQFYLNFWGVRGKRRKRRKTEAYEQGLPFWSRQAFGIFV